MLRRVVAWWRLRQLDAFLRQNKPFITTSVCWNCGTVTRQPVDMLVHEKRRRLGLCSDPTQTFSLTSKSWLGEAPLEEEK